MYPTSSLAIITPIVFIVLLVLFPLIGFFAGWKRALYWGIGNLAFYFIGLLIWMFAGTSISTAVEPFVRNLLGDRAAGVDLKTLISSVIAPVFFILVMIVANLLLLICYAAFVKRLLGLKKPKKDKENAKVKKVKVQTKNGKTQVAVTNTKWFNRLVGSISFGALMIPVTLSTTHAVAMMTTTSQTRATNSLCDWVYNSMQSVSKIFNPISYYNGENTGKDFDALFSVITLSQKTITYTHPWIGEINADPVDAITEVISKGMEDILEATKEYTDPKEGMDYLAGTITNLSECWDGVIELSGKQDIDTLFNSTGVTGIIKTFIGSSEPIAMDDTVVSQIVDENGPFMKFAKSYSEGNVDPNNPEHYIVEIEGQTYSYRPIQQVIETSKECFDNVMSAIYGMYDVSNLSKESQDKLFQVTEAQVKMIVNYKQ